MLRSNVYCNSNKISLRTNNGEQNRVRSSSIIHYINSIVVIISIYIYICKGFCYVIIITDNDIYIYIYAIIILYR